MSDRRRTIVSRTLATLASFVLLAAVVLGYVRDAAVDSGQFADRATAALRSEPVQTLIATRVTDRLILRNQSDLLAARPIIASVVQAAVGSRAFTGLFRAAARDVHAGLIRGDRRTVTLAIVDAGTVVAAGLEQLKPSLAAQVSTSTPLRVAREGVGPIASEIAAIADSFVQVALVLAIGYALLSAACVLIARDRRAAFAQLGTGAAAAGVVIVIAVVVARSVVAAQLPQGESRAAAHAVYDAFFADLRTAGWILAGIGTATAAAASSLLAPVSVGEPLRRLLRTLWAEPRRPVWRAARAALLLAAGVAVLLEPGAAVTVVIAAAGIALVYAGACALLGLIYDPAARAATAPGRRAWRRWVGTGAVTAGCVVVGAGWLLDGGAVTPGPVSGGPCDGAAALCGRPLNDVALAATHNAMAAPLPGWFSPQQEKPIPGQLADGIRGLLIDTYHGERLSDGRVRTDFASVAAEKLAADSVSPQALAAAMRLRDQIGFRGRGTRGLYLCHGFCELGATPLSAVLRQLREFLIANPRQVLVVVNEDTITPAQFVGAVREAGLAGLAYSGPVGARWWTLQQMIDRNERVVFFAERHGGAAPWYHAMYDGIVQETPYAFSSVKALTGPDTAATTCADNRGGTHAPLLLLNHFVSTDPVPLPSLAAKVNAYGPLLSRAEACRRIRGQIPNLVAVNFYREGALLRVVDALNGVG